MKRLTYAALALLFGASTALGQTKFDLSAASFIAESELFAQTLSRSGQEQTARLAGVIVVFADEESAKKYCESTSDDVRTRLDELVVVNLTAERMQQLAEQDDVVRIELGDIYRPMLDVAREMTGVDAANKGLEGLDMKYDGTGVMVGMMDTGFDPNHAAFFKDKTYDQDHNRITRMWTIIGSPGATTTYDTARQIANFTTDTKGQTHATHVMGIIAGSFNERGRTALKGGISRTKANPYYGVAPAAEIAAVCGTFESANVINAATYISDYAAEKNMPVVINFSLGNHIGPKDGSTAMNKALAKIGQKAIICLSAGNEGNMLVSAEKDFTASDKTFKTCLSSNAQSKARFVVWSNDDKPVKVTFVGVNKQNGSTTVSYTLPQATSTAKFVGGEKYKNYSNVEFNQALSDVFGTDALLQMSSVVDAANNRHQTLLVFETYTGTKGKNCVPAVIVEGDAGQHVNMYTSTEAQMSSNGLAGFSDGNNTNTISDLACGDNVITVGAYVNRDQYPTFDGTYGFSEKVDNIASFSSYGKTAQGVQLPHILGPGAGMISAYSKYYVENGTNEPLSGEVTKKTNGTDRNSYWAQMSGTSMSSPFVAGVIALWLQADPTLTVDDVKNVMKKTAINDSFTQAAPERSGMGRIDALAGLKEVIGRNSVGNVTAESEIVITGGNGSFSIFAPQGNIRAELFNMGGSLVHSQNADGNELNFEAPAAQKGVYLLRVTSGNETRTRKVTL